MKVFSGQYRCTIFTIVELNLYLDTHPECQKALRKFKEINEKRNQAYDTYVKKYGELKACDNTDEKFFNWVNDPWPWEGVHN